MHDLFKKWFGELIEREISGLRNYCNVVEEFIYKKKDDIGKKYDGLESIEHTHEDAYYRFTHQFEEEYFAFNVEYSNTFRSSIITLTYSFLESYLRKICDHVHFDKKLKFTIDDLGSSYVKNSKKYLTRACNIEFGNYPEWEFITKMNQLRNCIVHSRGKFKISQDKIVEIITEYDSIRLNNPLHQDRFNARDNSISYEIIIVDKKLGIEFIKNVESFLLILISEVFKEENTEDT